MRWIAPSASPPYELPDGGRISTLQEAIAYLARTVQKAEYEMREVQAAAHCVAEAAENNGPMLFARIGMMQAIHRHLQRVFDPSHKDPHWGKRKLKRERGGQPPRGVKTLQAAICLIFEYRASVAPR
jgi:hypothetical protein